MITKKKRSQVTIFLMLGVILFIAMFILIILNKNSAKNLSSLEITNANEIIFDSQPINKFVEECLSITSKDGLKKLGSQAGYLFISQGGPIADYPDSEEGISFVRYNNYEVAFGTKNEPKLKKESGQNSIQEQLAIFAANNIDECLDFSAFEKQGFVISKKDKTINVSINDKDTSFLMSYPVIFNKPTNGGKIEVRDFLVSHDIRLAKIYPFVNQLIERKNILEGNEGDFSVEIENDDLRKNRVIIITDKKSSMAGIPYQYIFARKVDESTSNFITGAAVSGPNNIPEADAGKNRSVKLLEETKLFGSGTDADGDDITFRWQMIDKPGGSASTLSQSNTPNPSFIPDLDGNYIFTLRTNDGKSFSNPSIVIVTSSAADPSNSKPVLYPGISRNANINQKMALAGFGQDNEGDKLSYMWMISGFPNGGNNWLPNSNEQSPVFTPNVAGNYVFNLIINDGKEDSNSSEVTITASSPGTNRAPSADPGYNKTVKIGSIVSLLGSGSDPDNDPLTFSWAIVTKPSGSQAVLSNNNLPNPAFTPDLEGDYIFSLVVDDGQLDSFPNTVKYTAKNTAGNNKPISDAGLNRLVNQGEEIELQGAGSDPDEDRLYYRWVITSMPANILVSLSNPNSQKPIFTPILKGGYTFGLIVNDGKEDSDIVSVNVTAVESGELCTNGTCDLIMKKWCSDGKYISQGYCDYCGNRDSTCPSCTGNVCDKSNRKWCESGVWVSGTYSQYCSYCSYIDANCPVCGANACDVSGRKWCNNVTWSVINYCSNCGSVDSYCKNFNVTCKNGVCDTKNDEWCNNGRWDTSNYCIYCSKADSSCSFQCSNNECDIKSKKWCSNGAWKQNDYCSRCGSKDFSCALACQGNACDTVANKWCNSGSWEFLNYCDRCQDYDCLNTCINSSCDVNTKKWCSNGVWASLNYCSNCGNKDSLCSLSCEENVCDTTANKRCLNGTWVSTNYCYNCALLDSECTILCAEGECNTINKKVCRNGEWTNVSYDSYCIAPPNISNNITLDICNDYGNCTINSPCINNTECASKFCLSNKCSQSICNDTIMNGNETDIDCGGNCNKCANGKKCNIDYDCGSSFCLSGLCSDNSSCYDEILNGNETDIDCGGACENKCELGQNCTLDSDCGNGLICNLQACSELKPDDGHVEEKDTDGDGMPDDWELKYGLNHGDQSDASLDLDKDGLANVNEYKFGTNPKNADSDNDGMSDRVETDNGTDPLDPLSKPGGIGGVLFIALMLIIIFGAGSYGAYYYSDYLKSKADQKIMAVPSGPVFIRKPIQPKPIIKSPPVRIETMGELVKKRRGEKEKNRQKLFVAFDKNTNAKKSDQGSNRLLRSFETKKEATNKNAKEDIFSKLKSIPKKEEQDK